MKQGGKGRRTRTRAEVNADRQGRAELMGSWNPERDLKPGRRLRAEVER